MNPTALIILNYNNYQDTRNCIESILRFNTAPVKFVIVDNASRPEERAKLKTALGAIFSEGYTYAEDISTLQYPLPFATLIETNENLGYARGNNAGLEAAYADPEVKDVMILNNDILFIEDIIPQLTAQRDALKDCAIISPLLLNRNLSDYDYNCARRNVSVSRLINTNLTLYLRRLINRGYNQHKSNYMLNGDTDMKQEVMKIELPSGSCMLTDKHLFQSIGSFDPNTFLYFEENILYKKIAKLGLQNYLSLTTRCVHLGAATTTKQSNGIWHIEQSKKSEEYYVSQYSGAGALTKRLHRLSVRFYLMLFRFQKKMQAKNADR